MKARWQEQKKQKLQIVRRHSYLAIWQTIESGLRGQSSIWLGSLQLDTGTETLRNVCLTSETLLIWPNIDLFDQQPCSLFSQFAVAHRTHHHGKQPSA